MKFTIQTDALAAALRIASVATTSGRSTLPILGNIKIEAKDKQVILSTTNLDIYVIQKVPAEVEKEGATTAPFSILSQLVGRMQSNQIAISLSKKEMEFRCGDLFASLETLEAIEFPPPVERSGEGVKCDSADIITPFETVQHAIGTDASRYILMGVNIAPDGEFIATDGRRLAIYAGIPLTKESATLPDQFVRALLKIQPEGEVEVFVGNGHITVESSKVEITAKLIEGTFPQNAKKLTPKSGKIAFSCGRQPLINALRTCAIYNGPKTVGVVLTGKEKEIEVSHSSRRAIELLLGTELTKQPKLCIKFNEQFLIDALDVLKEDDARIQVTDELSPALIEEGKFKAIIMPLRIG